MITSQHIPLAITWAAVPHGQLFWAWIAICLVLALHVADEAATGFLSVYNPTVMALRHSRPWLPLPVYTFRGWMAGLAAVNVLLLCLSIFVLRGARWMRPIGFVFAAVMFANGLVHIGATVRGRTVASLRFPRPLPGFYSSPLMILASLYLLCQL